MTSKTDKDKSSQANGNSGVATAGEVQQGETEKSSASSQPVEAGTIQDWATQVATATNTSVATWEYIINRESRGDSTILAYSVAHPEQGNMHGDLALAIQYARCYGLFQLQPTYFSMSGNDGSIAGQIATAIWLYNRQGFSAWGM